MGCYNVNPFVKNVNFSAFPRFISDKTEFLLSKANNDLTIRITRHKPFDKKTKSKKDYDY
jgi:hypothetical protein